MAQIEGGGDSGHKKAVGVKKAKKLSTRVDMTPMVDVVFQLLVFFVLASGGRVAEQSLSTVLSAGKVSAAETAVSSKQAVDHWIHLSRDAWIALPTNCSDV